MSDIENITSVDWPDHYPDMAYSGEVMDDPGLDIADKWAEVRRLYEQRRLSEETEGK